MPPRRIRIITDKSSISRHHADLLAKGSASSTNDIDYITIGDLARSPTGKIIKRETKFKERKKKN